jgi:hypothetical protein
MNEIYNKFLKNNHLPIKFSIFANSWGKKKNATRNIKNLKFLAPSYFSGFQFQFEQKANSTNQFLCEDHQKEASLGLEHKTLNPNLTLQNQGTCQHQFRAT